MHIKLNLLLRGGVIAALIGTAACSDAQPETPFAASAAAAAANELEAIPSVNLRLVMDTITRGMIADSTHEYFRPSSTAMARFRRAVDSVTAGNVFVADTLLDPYFYDVYRVRESGTGDTLVIFRERLAANDTVRYGWGTYIFNPRAQQRVDVHVNHPISDQNTEDIGIELYRDGRYRWFLVAGAERDANPQFMEADVAHTTSTVFQAVSTELRAANVRAISIHGFNIDGHPGLPSGADHVISNGTGQGYPAAFADLRTRLGNAGFTAGQFGVTAGYDELGGTTNVQGMSWRNVAQNAWMHLEIERNVRLDAASWRSMSTVLRAWFAAHPL